MPESPLSRMLSGSRWSRREWLGRGSLLTLLASVFRGSAAAAPVPLRSHRQERDFASARSSTSPSACGPSSTPAAPTRSSAARRCCPRCARPWTAAVAALRPPRRAGEAIGARLAELTKAEWGLVTSGCAAALTHATAACVAGGNPDLPRAHARPARLPAGRGDHPQALAERLRRRRARGGRAGDRGLDGRRAGGRVRAADGAWSTSTPGPNADSGPLSTQGHLRDREDEGRAGAGRRRRRGPDRSQRPPAGRRRPSWATAAASASAVRRARACSSAARTWSRRPGSTARRTTATRARIKVGKEEADGHAHGRGDVGEARPQGRVEPVAGVARPRDQAGHGYARRHHDRRPTRGPLEPHAVAERPVGSRQGRPRRRRREPPAPRRHTARGHAARGRHREGQPDRVSDQPLHDGAGRREDRGRSAVRRAVEPARAQGQGGRGLAGRRPHGPVGRPHRLRRVEIHPPPLPAPAGQPDRRLPPGRLRVARPVGKHRRRQGAPGAAPTTSATATPSTSRSRARSRATRFRAPSRWGSTWGRSGRPAATRPRRPEAMAHCVETRRSRLVSLFAAVGRTSRGDPEVRRAPSRRPRHRSARTARAPSGTWPSRRAASRRSRQRSIPRWPSRSSTWRAST